MLGQGRMLGAFAFLCALAQACSSPSAPVVEPIVAVNQQVSVAPRITRNPTLPARAYTDGTGTVLEFVPVKVRDLEGVHAVIRLSGVGEPFEGRPMLATRHYLDEGGNHWRIKVDGGTMAIIIVSKKRLGTSQMVLVLRGRKRRVTVSHDVDSSSFVDPAEILAAHREAVDSGEAARFESKDRQEHIDRGMLALESAQEGLDEACGESIPIGVVWDEMPDEIVGPQHFCHNVVEVLATICARNENSKADIVSKISKIRCLSGQGEPLLALTREGVLQVHRPPRRGLSPKQLYKKVARLIVLKPTVLRSDAGTHLVLNPQYQQRTAVHAGWAPTLHKQFATSYNSDEKMFLWSGDLAVKVRRSKTEKKWVAECPGAKTDFHEVSVEERDLFLQTATFGKRRWRHEPMALARDRAGTYFYVDKLTEVEGGLGHRLFKGPRGAVKQVELQDVILDNQSIIFITARTRLELRLKGDGVDGVMLGRGKRKSSRKLQMLPVGDKTNKSLIYNELGAYDGEVLGGICDLGPSPKP